MPTFPDDEYSRADENAPDDETPVTPEVSIARGDDGALEAAPDDEAANAAQAQSTGRDVARATAGIMPMHLARFVIGFLVPLLVANRLGLGEQSKAYAFATEILQRLWQLFEKVVNPSFLPAFLASLKEDGEERAWRFTATTLLGTLLILLVAVPLAWWQMPVIVHIYVNENKTSPSQIAAIVSIARLLLVGLPFLAISSLTYVILNGYKRFAAAALGDALWKLGVLISVLVAYQLKLAPVAAVYAITFGFIIGSFLKLLPHLVALRAKWHLLRAGIDWNNPRLKQMLRLAGPLMIGILFSEARSIYIATLTDDSRIQVVAGLAALKWSRLIGDTLLQIFPYALSIGVFPYLADLARERAKQPLTDTLVGALRTCIFVFAPLTAILIALRFPLLRALWESGNMTHQDTIDLSWPFLAYTLGLVGFACEMMLNQTFYAMTNVWTPTLVGIGTSALWVVMARLGLDYSGALAAWLGVPHNLGLASLAGAESVAKTVKCVLLWLLLRKSLGIVNRRENWLFLGKVVLASLVAGFAATLLSKFIAPGEAASHFKIKMLLAVTVAGCGGLAIYLAAGAATGLNEVRAIFAFAGKLKKRFAR